jgi:hypothetical protein
MLIQLDVYTERARCGFKRVVHYRVPENCLQYCTVYMYKFINIFVINLTAQRNKEYLDLQERRVLRYNDTVGCFRNILVLYINHVYRTCNCALCIGGG